MLRRVSAHKGLTVLGVAARPIKPPVGLDAMERRVPSTPRARRDSEWTDIDDDGTMPRACQANIAPLGPDGVAAGFDDQPVCGANFWQAGGRRETRTPDIFLVREAL